MVATKHEKNQKRRSSLESMEASLSASRTSKSREGTTKKKSANGQKNSTPSRPSSIPKRTSTNADLEKQEKKSKKEHQPQEDEDPTPLSISTILLHLFSVLLGIIACVLSFMVLRHCFLFHVQLKNLATGEPIEETMRGYGYFAREAEPGQIPDYQSCVAYTPVEENETFDDWWFLTGKMCAARAAALGTISTVLLFICVVVLMSFKSFRAIIIRCGSCAIPLKRVLFFIVIGCYTTTTILQGLSFLVFGTKFCQNHICKVGEGTFWNMCAVFLWLCTWILLLVQRTLDRS